MCVSRSDRWTIWIIRRADQHSALRWASTAPRSGWKKASTVHGPRSSIWMPTSSRRLMRSGTSSALNKGREGQTYRGASLASRYASFVKLPHTLFALPFAGVGALLASYTFMQNVTMQAVLWILVAFTAARFAAMGFNRIVDRKFDAINPRTMLRELPAGKLTMPQAIGAVVLASALFVFASFQL